MKRKELKDRSIEYQDIWTNTSERKVTAMHMSTIKTWAVVDPSRGGGDQVLSKKVLDTCKANSEQKSFVSRQPCV